MLLEINRDKKIVIDEFHRLDLKNNILISSTSWFVNYLLKKDNPLVEYNKEKISLARPTEVLNSLKDKIKNKEELVKASIFLREVFFANFYKTDIINDLTDFLEYQKYFFK